MFFNENLLLENDTAPVDAEPMKEDEIKDAVEECGGADCVSKIEEAADFEIAGLQETIRLNECYYNLREKMMNIEHVASLKEAKGLISESEMILQEGFDGFLNGVKAFFRKLLDFIKQLFNRFVEFITGRFVSVKAITEANATKAYDAYIERNKELKVKIYNLSDPVAFSKEVTRTCTAACSDLQANTSDLLKYYKSAKSGDSANLQVFLDKPKKMLDQLASKNDLNKAILQNFTNFNKNTGENSDFLLKKEVSLKKADFAKRAQFVIKYQALLGEVKKSREDAKKTVNECIKAVNEFAKNATPEQKKIQGKIVAQIKWDGSSATTIFNKVTSVMGKMYQESLAIVRRVMGGNNAADAVNKAKSMTEGFDYASYFNDAFQN